MKLWRYKWSMLRLVIASFVLCAVVADTDARLARLAYSSLPDFDFVSEVSFLRQAGRFGEAVMVADEGLRTLAGDSPVRQNLAKERAAAVHDQFSYIRRIKDVGLGAISGRGETIEGLIGAIAADFFIVGDVRDLVIQSGRYVLDGEADPLVVILSGVGIATTVAPEVDWIPAVLKAARKAGAITKGLGEEIIKLAKRGGGGALEGLFKDVRKLAARASPGGAMRLMRHAGNADELATLARFVERNPAGAFALHVTGKEGAELIKTGSKAESRALKAAAAGTEEAVVLAAKKGQPGIAWLRTAGYRAMVRPHFLVGIGKALWKGNASRVAARLAEMIDPRANWLVPLLGTWVFVELALLLRAFWPKRDPVGRAAIA